MKPEAPLSQTTRSEVEVISYQKKLKKSQQTYRDLGDAGAEKVKDLDAEIAVIETVSPTDD